MALGAAMTAPAADTPAQAAARVALEAKLKELNAQCPAPNPVEAPPAAKNKTCAPAAKQVSKASLTPKMQSELPPAKHDVVMKPVSSETSPVTCQQKVPADKAVVNAQTAADKKAKQEAAEAKAKQDAAQAAADAKAAADKKAKQEAAAAKAKQDAAQAAAQLKAKKEAQAAADAKAAADKKAKQEAAAAKAKQDAAQAAAQLKAKKEAQAAAAAKAKQDALQAAAEKKAKAEADKKLAELKQAETEAAKPGKMDSPGAELGLHQIAAPALPIAASKESRLQTLLGKYKTNQLTPEEYHKQRAAILAEP